jgi:tetratricopeptide (TPR) repeat protein
MGEARAWMNQDFVKAQAAARRAVEKGSAEGAGLLVARAFGILCQTQGNGSSTSQTIADCEHARHSFAAAGDRNNEARTLNDFAGLYYQMGDLGQAERMFREAISVFRKIGDIEGVTVASSNLGDISLARGDLADAARALSDAVPGYNAMGDKDGVALTLNDLGEVARRRGNLEAALATYREARTTADEIDDKSAVAHILAGVGDVEKDRGDLGAARKSYEESLNLRRQTGEKQGIAETELALALLSLEEGHPGDAENVIRRCKEQFHQDHTADDELSAGIALMDVLVAEGKYGQAAIEEVAQKRLATSSTNQLILFQLDLSSGRIDLASGNLASSRLQLEHTLENAKTHHLLGLELEARLALVDLQKKSGQGSAARTSLVAVEKLARNRGFGLIATKAQSLDGEAKKKSP